jgi:ABC-type amino acid transport substrate-binding protein
MPRLRGWLPALLLALAPPPALPAPDLAELKTRGTLRVLVTPEEYPEWFSLKGGADPGFERELLEGFAQLQRVTLETVIVPSFDGIIPALLAGKGDLIAGIIDTPARRKKIAFSAEVLPSRHLAICLRSQTAPRTLGELRTRKLGVVAGTTWAEVAREHVPAAQITTFERADEVLRALHSGSVNASVVVLSEYLSSRRTEPELEAGLFLGPRVSAAWGVRLGDAELKGALDAYLALKKQSMGFSRLVVKYFGADAMVILDRATSR